MPHENPTLIGVLEKISNQLGGDHDWQHLAAFTKSLSDPEKREQLILTYTIGELYFQFKGKTLYGFIESDQYDINGDRNGSHNTIWTPLVPPDQLSKQPFFDFKGPWDKPDPIPDPVVRVNTKAIWRFKDGSDIRATGPANALLTLLAPDKAAVLHVSVAAIITGGSGKFEHCRGVKTAAGSSFLPAGSTFEDIVKERSKVVTLEAFRVVRHNHQSQPPASGTQAK